MIEVDCWKKSKRTNEAGFFVRVDRDVALRIIMSLASQLYHNSPNRDRAEHRTDKDEYFSIGVMPPPAEEKGCDAEPQWMQDIRAKAAKSLSKSRKKKA
jgi:hypothetical protein